MLRPPRLDFQSGSHRPMVELPNSVIFTSPATTLGIAAVLKIYSRVVFPPGPGSLATPTLAHHVEGQLPSPSVKKGSLSIGSALAIWLQASIDTTASRATTCFFIELTSRSV